MSPYAALVTAAMVTITIAIVFAVWGLRAYLDHQQTMRRTLERFAAIRADALDNDSRFVDPDLNAQGLVNLLYEMRSFNLADVPRGLIARGGQLVRGPKRDGDG